MSTPQELRAVEAERTRVLAMVRAARAQYHPKFPDWLLTHYDIWLEFKRAGDQLAAKGHKNCSAFMVANVLRFRAMTHGRRFSMSNTLLPDLARLYNADHGPLFTTSSRFGRETTRAGAVPPAS